MTTIKQTSSSTFVQIAAVVMGGSITLAGITHFANPSFFNDIVPPWLPPSESFWTYVSGVAELAVGPMLLMPKFRRRGALAAVILFVAVYPANLYMVWDWRHEPLTKQLVSYGRLPFQFLFIGLALKIWRHQEVSISASAGSLT